MGQSEDEHNWGSVPEKNTWRWGFGGRHWGRRMWGHHMEQKFWGDIEKGIEEDIVEMKREGVSSEEYWKKVWSNIQNEKEYTPEQFHNPRLKERWEELKSAGKLEDFVRNNTVNEETVSFMWIPMMKRWRKIGTGNEEEDFHKHMQERMEKHIVANLSSDLKSEYEQMKQENKEAEFWRSHWRELHSAHGGDSHPWAVPEGSSGENGTYPDNWRRGRHGYGRHGGQWRWIRRRKAEFEDEPIYKEFDFC